MRTRAISREEPAHGAQPRTGDWHTCVMTLVSDLPVDEIKLSDQELWTAPDEVRDAVFAKLRAEKPISFQPEPEYEMPMPPGPGYWALTRHKDIWAASRNPELFCSGKGVQHRRHAARDRRVLRVDDRPRRPEAHPPADDRAEGIHAEGRRRDRGGRASQGQGDRRRARRARRGRLRRSCSPLRFRCRSSAR